MSILGHNDFRFAEAGTCLAVQVSPPNVRDSGNFLVGVQARKISCLEIQFDMQMGQLTIVGRLAREEFCCGIGLC